MTGRKQDESSAESSDVDSTWAADRKSKFNNLKNTLTSPPQELDSNVSKTKPRKKGGKKYNKRLETAKKNLMKSPAVQKGVMEQLKEAAEGGALPKKRRKDQRRRNPDIFNEESSDYDYSPYGLDRSRDVQAVVNIKTCTPLDIELAMWMKMVFLFKESRRNLATGLRRTL